MDRRQAYEAELLSSFARMGSGARIDLTLSKPAICDEDRDNEWRAHRAFFSALDTFRSGVTNAAALTSLRNDALEELILRLDDAAPDSMAWEEAIAEATHER